MSIAACLFDELLIGKLQCQVNKTKAIISEIFLLENKRESYPTSTNETEVKKEENLNYKRLIERIKKIEKDYKDLYDFLIKDPKVIISMESMKKDINLINKKIIDIEEEIKSLKEWVQFVFIFLIALIFGLSAFTTTMILLREKKGPKYNYEIVKHLPNKGKTKKVTSEKKKTNNKKS